MIYSYYILVRSVWILILTYKGMRFALNYKIRIFIRISLLRITIFFAKGSERFDRWFKASKIYKNHLESFDRDRSMTLKTKLTILIPVSLMLLFAFFRYDILPMRITIAVLIAFKYYYFLKVIKTIEA